MHVFGNEVKSPFVYVFAGGSRGYTHIGANALLYTFAEEYKVQQPSYTPIPPITPYERREACLQYASSLLAAAIMKVIPVMTFGMQAGVFNYSGTGNTNEDDSLGGSRTGFYIALRAGLGGYVK